MGMCIGESDWVVVLDEDEISDEEMDDAEFVSEESEV